MADKKTVLIVGGGGREHAIAWKLAQSPRLGALYAAPGNAGIAALARCFPVAADDVAGQVDLARKIGADLVVVGPELPLSLGLVDALQRIGVAVVGPVQAAARIESSKQFAKKAMAAAGIPTAAYDVATDVETAEAIIAAHFSRSETGTDPDPLVLKADGLAAGKGVVICTSEAEARAEARNMLTGKVLGGAGATLVLEQFLTGPEVSLLAFCDGTRAVPMPLARDYKRLLAGDKGPNTGGMGSISPVPGCDDALRDELMATCVQPLLDEMVRRGTPFRGILFAGIMLTPSGPMVLEYNARFGDPETQSVLCRLESDLLEIFVAMAAGNLASVQPRWSEKAACCIVIAARGYPTEWETGKPVSLPGCDGGAELSDLGRSFENGAGTGKALPDVIVFHSATERNKREQLISSGGRILGVTAMGNDLLEASRRAYRAVGEIAIPDSHFRNDIGR